MLAQAMRDEIAVMYDGLALDGDTIPKAGPEELSPPAGSFMVGPKQVNPRGLYQSEGYLEIEDFNDNPVATFWGQKSLG